MTRLFFLFALLVTPLGASADYLYSDPFNYDSIGGSGTYNSGGYTRLDSNDVNSSYIHENTIRDNSTGTLYDCNYIGSCTSRY